MAYSAPTPADLRARYPALAGLEDATVQTRLDDAAEDCPTFPDEIRARAEMALAAHYLAASGQTPGVVRFRSGSFDVQFADTTANRTGLDATPYGIEFQTLRRRAFAGPILAWTPPAPCW